MTNNELNHLNDPDINYIEIVEKLNNKKLPTKNYARKHYSSDRKSFIKSLRQAGMSYRDISKSTGVSVGTCHRYCSESSVLTDGELELSERLIGQLRAKFNLISHKVLDSITDDDLEKASLRDKSVSAGIFADKVSKLSESKDLSHERQIQRVFDVRAKSQTIDDESEAIRAEINKLREALG